MADKDITLKVKAEDQNAGSTIKGLGSKLNALSKSAQKSPLLSLGKSLNPTVMIFKELLKTIDKTIKVIKELNAVSLKQIGAEKQLEAAAKNNPYLTGQSVKELKNYASHLQKIGTIGDEELLPMMSRLAAAGRTQAEIQKIMSAALDLSASGAMSMESAVSALNATYQGNAGQLSRNIKGIKDLTAEELKQGKAVDVVAKQYKGMASEMTKATGSGKQLNNALGDLKEQLGMGFTKIIAPIQRLFTNLVTSITGVITGINKLFGIVNDDINIKPSDIALQRWNDLKKELETTNNKIEEMEKVKTQLTNTEEESAEATKQYFKSYEEYLTGIARKDELVKKGKKQRTEEEEKEYSNLKKALQDYEYGYIQSQEEMEAATARFNELRAKGTSKTKEESKEQQFLKRAKQIYIAQLEEENKERETGVQAQQTMIEEQANSEEEETKLIDLKKESADLQQKILDAEQEYNKLRQKELDEAGTGETDYLTETLAKKEKEINLIKASYEAKRALGEEDTELAEQQEIYNAELKYFMELMTTGKDKIDLESDSMKDFTQEVIKDGEALKQIADEQAKLNHGKNLVLQWDKTETDQMKAALEDLKALKTQLEEQPDLADALGLKPEQVDAAIKNCQEAIDRLNFDKVISAIGSVIDTLNTGLSNFNSYFQEAMDTQIQLTQQKSENESAALAQQYADGELSYEEYNEKKEQLDRKAAQKEYQYKMAQWHMNLAMAQAQAAQAVVNALASGEPPINILNAVAAGALGTAQVVAMMGSKPRPPQFSTGGFLTGSSTHGDKIPFMGNAGEAILNPAEQRNFLNLANGNATGQNVTINMPINIQNNASNDVSVTATREMDNVRITIDKQVNASMKNGVYNDSLGIAQNSRIGKKIL